MGKEARPTAAILETDGVAGNLPSPRTLTSSYIAASGQRLACYRLAFVTR